MKKETNDTKELEEIAMWLDVTYWENYNIDPHDTWLITTREILKNEDLFQIMLKLRLNGMNKELRDVCFETLIKDKDD